MGTVDEEVRKLGRAVRALRRSRGWTQARLAEESGVGRDALVKLEQGAREPRPATLDKVGAALGADLFAVLREGALRHVPGLQGSDQRPEEPRRKPPRRGAAGSREYALALASRPVSDDAPGGVGGDERGGEGRWTLEEILGGTEPLAEALERARGADLLVAGLPDAPRLASGEGLSDEVVAQRDARPY